MDIFSPPKKRLKLSSPSNPGTSASASAPAPVLRYGRPIIMRTGVPLTGRTSPDDLPYLAYDDLLGNAVRVSRVRTDRFDTEQAERAQLTEVFILTFTFNSGEFARLLPQDRRLAVNIIRSGPPSDNLNEMQAADKLQKMIDGKMLHVGSEKTSMHIKIVLAIYGTFARFTLLSANIDRAAFEMTMTNLAFVHDFPLAGPDGAEPHRLRENLRELPGSFNVKPSNKNDHHVVERFRQLLDKVDFGATLHGGEHQFELVLSISQTSKTGFERLRKAVDKQLKIQPSPGSKAEVIYSCSSVKIAGSGWLKKLQLIVAGNKSIKKLQIVFPSKDRMREVKPGLSTKYFWEENDMPFHEMRRYFYDANFGPQVKKLCHDKIIVVLFDRACDKPALDSSPKQCWGWFMMGSANITEGAWGQKKGNMGQESDTPRNWEANIVMPIFAESREAADVFVARLVPWNELVPYDSQQLPSEKGDKVGSSRKSGNK